METSRDSGCQALSPLDPLLGPTAKPASLKAVEREALGKLIKQREAVRSLCKDRLQVAALPKRAPKKRDTACLAS